MLVDANDGRTHTRARARDCLPALGVYTYAILSSLFLSRSLSLPLDVSCGTERNSRMRIRRWLRVSARQHIARRHGLLRCRENENNNQLIQRRGDAGM